MRNPNPMLLLVAASALAIPGAALAGGGRPAPANSQTYNCWGVVTSQLAHVEGGIGEHTSSQANPRLGLGNVARLFDELGLSSGSHVSDLGSALAGLDEYDETFCPVE